MLGIAILVLLAAAAVVDARTGRIPHALTLPLGLVTVQVVWDQPEAAAGAAVLVAVYLAGFCAHCCGGGDVKLAPACGALVGAPALGCLTVLLAAMFTVLVCATTRRSAVPHAPSMVVATVVVVLCSAR